MSLSEIRTGIEQSRFGLISHNLRIPEIRFSREKKLGKEREVEAPLGYSVQAGIDQIKKNGIRGEDLVYWDTVTYITEHVWKQLLTPVPYNLFKDSETGQSYLTSPYSSRQTEPVSELFRKAAEIRKSVGMTAFREEAEVRGFLNIEEACGHAEKEGQFLAILWFSPPGPKTEGYDKTGRTFFGVFNPKTKHLEEYSLIDLFSKEERAEMLNNFSGTEEIYDNDVDFLSRPAIMQIGENTKAQDVMRFIDEYLTGKRKTAHKFGKPIDDLKRFEATLESNPALRDLLPYFEDQIRTILVMMKQGKSLQEIYRSFRALTVYAKNLLEDYCKNGGVSKIEKLSTVEVNSRYQFHRSVVDSTSCPTIGMDPNKPYAYLNEHIGPTDDFHCPYCGELIRFGSGTKVCPGCKAEATCA